MIVSQSDKDRSVGWREGTRGSSDVGPLGTDRYHRVCVKDSPEGLDSPNQQYKILIELLQLGVVDLVHSNVDEGGIRYWDLPSAVRVYTSDEPEVRRELRDEINVTKLPGNVGSLAVFFFLPMPKSHIREKKNNPLDR